MWHSIEQLLSEVGAKITALRDQIAREQATLDELNAAGLIYAGTWMKAGKYLYLIYPSDGFGYRQRKYVGADPAEQQKALDGIQRAEEFELHKTRQRRMTAQLTEITGHLQRAFQC